MQSLLTCLWNYLIHIAFTSQDKTSSQIKWLSGIYTGHLLTVGFISWLSVSIANHSVGASPSDAFRRLELPQTARQKRQWTPQACATSRQKLPAILSGRVFWKEDIGGVIAYGCARTLLLHCVGRWRSRQVPARLEKSPDSRKTCCQV